MAKRFFQFFLFAGIAIIVVSCSTSVPKQADYIPKDAFMVADFNTASLAEKAKKGNINWDSLFTNFLKNAEPVKSEEIKQQLSKMSEAGIDFQDHFFVYVKMSGSMMSGQSVTTGVVAGMKDAAKFEAYIKAQQGVTPIQLKDDYSYTVLHNEVGIGWNKNVAILVYATPLETRNATDVVPNDGKTSLAALDQMMHLKQEESVAAIDDFKTLMKEKADVLYWSNSEGIISSIPFVGMTKMGDLFKGTHSAGTLNFEDGKVVANVKSYMGKDLADILKKYPSAAADMNMVTQYPSQVMGYICFSINPKILLDIIKYAGVESTANQFLSSAGFTMDDIAKAFSGDVAVMVSDYGLKPTTIDIAGEKITYNTMDIKYIFNAKIADVASYNKIAAGLVSRGVMEEVNGQYLPKDLRGAGWLMNGKNLIMGSNDSLVQLYVAGKGNAAIPKDISSAASGKSFSMFADIQKFLQQGAVDSSSINMITLAKSTFKDFRSTADKMDGNSVISHMDLYTMNDKENSLVTLIHYFAASAQEMKQRMDEIEKNGMTDLDSVPPPMVDTMPIQP